MHSEQTSAIAAEGNVEWVITPEEALRLDVDFRHHPPKFKDLESRISKANPRHDDQQQPDSWAKVGGGRS